MNDATYRVIDLATKTAAVAVGATWTYTNYVRSRTHQLRCELQVKGTCETSEGSTLLYVSSSLKNVGLAKFELHKAGCMLVVARRRIEPAGGPLSTKEIGVIDVFARHGWIEPGEQIADEDALTVALTEEDAAFSVELRVTGVAHGRALQRWKERLLTSAGGRIATAVVLLLSMVAVVLRGHMEPGWAIAALLLPMGYVGVLLVLWARGVERHAEWSSRCVVKISSAEPAGVVAQGDLP